MRGIGAAENASKRGRGGGELTNSSRAENSPSAGMDPTSTPGESISMNKRTAPPGPETGWPVTITKHIDGTRISVSVSTQPGMGTEPCALLLRLLPSLLDVLFRAYLASAEACQPAGALTDAAIMTVDDGVQACIPAAEHLIHAHSHRAEQREHSVTVCEGSTVSDLCWILNELPAHARLVDFASDTDVTLVFRADSVALATDHD